MPSTTFFNLPEQKRETLLAAARAEFARVPCSEASINQIIRAAGIPRGSFYMYFRDKDELFSYLMVGYVQIMGSLVVTLMSEHKGDPFAALLATYDHIVCTARDPEWASTYKEVLQIVSRNGAALIGAFVNQATPAILDAAKDVVDQSLLNLKTERDLELSLLLLISVTAETVQAALQHHDPAAARERLIHTFDILKRGMCRREPANANIKE